MNNNFTLAISAISLFVIFGLAGFIWNRHRCWKVIDLFYYPIGAVGVWLLFNFQTIDRESIVLGNNIKRTQNELKDIKLNRPVFDSNIEYQGYISEHAALFYANYGQYAACPVPIPECGSIGELSRIMDEYIPSFRAERFNDIDIGLWDLCDSADRLVDEVLASKIIDDEFKAQLKLGFMHSYNRRFPANDTAAVANHIDKFEASMRDGMLSNTIAFPGDKDNEHAAAIIDLLRSYQSCFLNPDGIRSEIFTKWIVDKREKEEQLQKANTDYELKQDSDGPISGDDSLRFVLWPYFVMLALAMKWGKGWASISAETNTRIKKLFSVAKHN